MIELPEAVTLAQQIRRTLAGRRIEEVEANHTPHGMTGFRGDPASYPALLRGRTVTGATAWGGLVQVEAGDVRVVLGDGAHPHLVRPGEPLPAKHQLHLGLDDGASLVVTVQMYGGIEAFLDAENDNPYYQVAVARPSPLSAAFDAAHLARLLDEPGARGRSAKAFLATGQRVPGLGNGTLQDILWNARVQPARRISTLSDMELDALLRSVRQTLTTMTEGGGRDTERDLFGAPGGYATVMGRATLERPCPRCGGHVVKKAYLGGAVYFCLGCQV